jgi:hypothetical protein
VYVSGSDGYFSKLDCGGQLVWSTNYGPPVSSMVFGPGGTRLVAFTNGAIGRLVVDAVPELPGAVVNPSLKTLFAGENVTFSCITTGTPPFSYFWHHAGTNLPTSTGTSLSLTNVNAAHAGAYAVVVTNAAGAVTSTPAMLRVKSVQLYLGSQMLTNGTYVFATPPTLTVRSTFPSGSSFYTLDGSPPSFASTFYSGPFQVQQSATVRAIGYSADFMQSEEADAVNATVLVNHTLSATASGGGSVTLSPPGGTYLSTNVVAATAVPLSGWSFLYWLGDASGTSPAVNISMEHDTAIHAVFGTTLATTVAGSGQVLLDPPGGVYPYGSTVRLTAVPDLGNYFGFWGNAATGNTNPLHFTIIAPTQTVSCIFGATPAGQAALTVQISGRGGVDVDPRANAYLLNQSVMLTGVPDAGQSFLNWSGDGGGTQNPLPITMSAAKVVTANFTGRPSLRVDRPGLEGLTPEGFRLTLVSEPASVYEMLASTNLTVWESLGRVTNFFGEAQFTDPTASGVPGKFYKATP